MGLFGSRAKTYVSSQVYNLAGDKSTYIDPVKATMIGAVLTDKMDRLTDLIVSTNQQNPAKNHERFYRHVLDNDPDRLFKGGLSTAQPLDGTEITDALLTAIALGPNDTIRVQNAVIDEADTDYFAEGFLGENRPNTTEDEWTSDWDSVTNEIVIQRQDTGGLIEEIRIATPADYTWAFDNDAKLLYVLYQVVTQDPIDKSSVVSNNKLFTYRMGTTNADLNALDTSDGEVSGFYPVYFLRRFNNSVRDYPDELATLNAAYRKLTGGSAEALLDQIETNSDLGKIDFIYLFQGVSMGTENQAELEYLWHFFRMLKEAQPAGTKSNFEARDRVPTNYGDIVARDMDIERTQSFFDTFFDEIIPQRYPQIATPPKTFEITFSQGDNALSTFDRAWQSNKETKFRYKIRWSFIEETLHQGNGAWFDGDMTRTELKKGDYFMAQGPDRSFYQRDTIRRSQQEGGDYSDWVLRTVPTVYMMYQYDFARYRRLEIGNLDHLNFVYKSYSEQTFGVDALGDPNTGFLVPLHQPTLDLMTRRRRGELAMSTSHLVFNAYEKQEIAWYQRSFFKVLLFIAAFAISFMIPGIGAAAGAGIFGTNVAVGTALGVTGATMAAMVGAAVNMIGAMVITSIIQWGATELLGEKWGAIIGTVVSFFAMNMVSTYMSTGTFAVDWTSVFQVENLMKLTNAVGESYTRWLAFEREEIYEDMADAQDEYESESERIQGIYDEVLGNDLNLFDPMILTEAALNYSESRDAFLSRTLMTGSDIANLSNGLISNFTTTSLTLPRAIT